MKEKTIERIIACLMTGIIAVLVFAFYAAYQGWL